MKTTKPWKVITAFLALTEGVGALSGFLTREGVKIYQTLPKPPLTPPPMVFPIVWSVLFALMGIGAAQIWRAKPSQERTQALRIFGWQLAVNFFWSLIFFNAQWFGVALLWLFLLWVLIVGMIRRFGRVNRTAAWLQVPYLLWSTFALYLTAATWWLNG